MVAVIKTGHSLLRLLNYNENKVKEGAALCIGAGNYPIDYQNLSFEQKLARLQNQAALNENVTRNSVHISLNFDPSENLSEDRLREIADAYMKGIGFDDLPYLMYQHFDAGHPHIHLVSVKVRADGKRVDTQNIGQNQSEKTRRELEKKYGLVKADDSSKQQAYRLKPVNAQKVAYGRTETRRAIANVLENVLPRYKFASLAELNAVLQLYNVAADRGGEGSRIFRHRGLVYRVLDDEGNKVGVPIKASDIYNKPGLKFLEAKFATNDAAKQPHRVRVKNAIDLALLHGRLDLNGLISVLKDQGIDTVIRQNENGVIYGITYVDHAKGCVFNGSALGKAYSAKAILERCTNGGAGEQKTKLAAGKKIPFNRAATGNSAVSDAERKQGGNPFPPGDQLPNAKGLADVLLEPDFQGGQMDWQLKRTKKKRKRQQLPPQV
ncbi:relaxase/mobilization nuclease domain-containing protein [Mucilaginibacter paludis]|uniref:Relaxase/mobilization nuclease family protein n=1 Tax=Mucilaginibacter paludis DSM 18603 TaxID=714943 RepID=H1YI29_9SPHI|nr:relaxase/mobilization nuclease domain-containing protein [Mucilaginibacter paludis]EHQ25577.1 Relaxase/mobilization nuclease family protein [Mucilaginibacter paludis DSM 18603]